MTVKKSTVVFCPCPGAFEIQEVHAQLDKLGIRLRDELAEQYAERDEDGEFVTGDCGEWVPRIYKSDEAKIALAQYELSLRAFQVCRDALAVVNEPFIKLQEQQAMEGGSIPDFSEALGKSQEGSGTLYFDSTFSSDGHARIPAGEFDASGVTFSAKPALFESCGCGNGSSCPDCRGE